MNAVTFLAIVAGGALLGSGAVVGYRHLRHARMARLKAEVRPILFHALDTGEIDGSAIARLDSSHQRALEEQARALLPNLRGQDRDTLTRLLEHRGAVDKARKQTRSRRASARAEAGALLGAAGTASAVPDLITLLRDDDTEVRWAAARGLGRIGHPSAVPALLGALEGPRGLPVDLVIDVVFQIRDCPISVLKQGLRSRSAPTRAATVELLGRFQALSATHDVIEVLNADLSFEVRARAARALGRIGSPHALEPLLTAVDQAPLVVRAQAIWALGEVGAVDAVPALRTALLGSSRLITDAAAKALIRIVPLGATILAQVAENEGYPAVSARQALSEMEGRVAV